MNFYSIRTSKLSSSNRLISMFAIMMAINYPLYLLIWSYSNHTEYLGTELRLLATVLCLILLFRNNWPAQIKKWIPVYWYGTVAYCLPFFFVFMTLKNHGEVLWIMNTLSALFLTLMILDFFSALLVSALGCLVAWGVFGALGNQFIFIPGTVTILDVSATFFAAIVIGSIFTRVRGITEDERLQWEAEQHEAKLLRLENERQQIALQEKEKLVALAHKVAHDICSPLSALTMMTQLCDELPKEKRSVINRATESILDIANNLLSTYRKEEPRATIEQRQVVLVSKVVHQLLSEKKVQYCNHAIKFSINIADDAQFAFIDVQSSAFRRSLSNLINNAVDALNNSRHGLITIYLTVRDDAVSVAIEDNGKGMSVENRQKIQQRQEFTEGKAQGHGLGLQQVWDMLEYNRGKLDVQSTLEKGTMIQLTFPKAPAANWIAQQINLASNRIILILDDEESIHGAWDIRFAPLLAIYPELALYHFTQGQQVLDFVDDIKPSQKDRVMLLSDYELLHQPRNGLEIIQASDIKQSILVTSHYANSDLRDTATKLKIKILPKQMASVIPIHVE